MEIKGRTRIWSNSKKIDVTKSYIGQEVVEIHERQSPEETLNIESEKKVSGSSGKFNKFEQYKRT